MFIQQIQCQNILTKSNLPVCDFSVNPYVGCSHACKYCYASYMKRFTNHTGQDSKPSKISRQEYCLRFRN